MPLRTGGSTTDAGSIRARAGGNPFCRSSGLVAQQSFFESSAPATPHGQADAGEFTSEQAECLGEAVRKIVIATMPSAAQTQRQGCWLEHHRRLGCKPNHHACHRDRATNQREGEGELHADTKRFRSMRFICSGEAKASCLLSRDGLDTPTWITHWRLHDAKKVKQQ